MTPNERNRAILAALFLVLAILLMTAGMVQL